MGVIQVQSFTSLGVRFGRRVGLERDEEEGARAGDQTNVQAENQK